MVQVRIMHTTDAALVAEVTEILLPWIAQCPDLIMGDPVDLSTRGGNGSRIVFELIPAHRAGKPGPVRVRAERVDDTERSSVRRPRRRALPPGS